MAQTQTQVRIHVEEKKERNGLVVESEVSKPLDYNKEIVPINAIVANMLGITTAIPFPECPDDEGPIDGFSAMFATLCALYFCSKESRWLAIRDKVCVGLVKDTKKHGNTSVSMGAAKQYMQTVPKALDLSTGTGSPIYVGFLNCGTGGVKYQLYCLKDGILFIVDEYKPKEGIVASPNGLSCLDYKPKKEISMIDNQALLGANMLHVKRNVVPQGVKCQWFAFITGPWREAWEKATPEKKVVHQNTATEFFQCDPEIQPLSGKSFFMTQDDEGILELLGTKRMYENLLDAGLLDGVSICGSFGIGRGSCQWMTMNVDQTFELTGHGAGMTNNVGLAGVKQVIINGYKDKEKFNRFLNVLESTLNRGLVPVIALKSGCTILLEKDKELKTIFTRPKVDPVSKIDFPLSLKTNMFCWEVCEPITDPSPMAPWILRQKLILGHGYLCDRYSAPRIRQAFDTFVSTLSSEDYKLICAMYSGLETLSYLNTLRNKADLIPDIAKLLDQTLCSVGKEQKFEDGSVRTTSMMTGLGINALTNQDQSGKTKNQILGIKITHDKIEVTLMRSHNSHGLVELRTEEVSVCFSNLCIGKSQVPKMNSEIGANDVAQMLNTCLNKFTDKERNDSLIVAGIVGTSGEIYEGYSTLARGIFSDEDIDPSFRLSEQEKKRQQIFGQQAVTEMDSWVKNFLTEHPLLKKHGIRPLSLTSSFFVLSEQASWLETVATTFHNKYVYPEGRVVLVLDTNKTQARVWMNQVGGKAKSLIHPHGLNDAKYLYDPTFSATTSLRNTVEKYMTNPANLQSFCGILRETVNAGYKPLIALKSAQALLLNRQPKCLEILID